MNNSANNTPAAGSRQELFARFGRRPSYSPAERTIRYVLRTMAWLTIGVTVSIIAVLLFDAINFFRLASFWEFISGTAWEPFGEPKKLGILPLLAGTMMIAVGAICVAVPLGLGTAIYLSLYAPRNVRDIIGPVVEVLGGVPTVVYGYFALTVLTPFLRIFFPEIEVFNALSGAIVVGIAILPMISSLSAEAMRLVPMSIRNAGYALGMRKFHIATKIVIPAATSGIVASIILAFSRAIGETMAVTLAAGATPNLDFDYLGSIQTITAFIVQISLGDTPSGSIEYYTIYALGLSLFFMTFFINYLATRIVKRFREAYN